MSACVLGHVQLFEIPWTIVCQAPLSMGLSRQEYWSGLSCPPPGGLPNPGIKPMLPMTPALQVDSLPLEPSRRLQGLKKGDQTVPGYLIIYRLSWHRWHLLGLHPADSKVSWADAVLGCPSRTDTWQSGWGGGEHLLTKKLPKEWGSEQTVCWEGSNGKEKDPHSGSEEGNTGGFSEGWCFRGDEVGEQGVNQGQRGKEEHFEPKGQHLQRLCDGREHGPFWRLKRGPCGWSGRGE